MTDILPVIYYCVYPAGQPRRFAGPRAGRQGAERGCIDGSLPEEITSPRIPEEQHAAIVNGGV